MTKVKNLSIWMRDVTIPFEYDHAEIYVENQKEIVVVSIKDDSGVLIEYTFKYYEFPIVNIIRIKYEKDEAEASWSG